MTREIGIVAGVALALLLVALKLIGRFVGNRVTVDDETFMILNDGRTYGSALHSSKPVTSFSLFFRPGMADDVARLDDDPVRCLDPKASAAMVAEIDQASRQAAPTPPVWSGSPPSTSRGPARSPGTASRRRRSSRRRDRRRAAIVARPRRALAAARGRRGCHQKATRRPG